MPRYDISMQGASSLREDGADCVVLVCDIKSVGFPACYPSQIALLFVKPFVL
jgi:hypothetical protein